MNRTIRNKSDITDEVLRQPNMSEAQRREWAIGQLWQKAEELGKLPRKADFVDVDCIRIKAALGPWPRALEAAGLKIPKAERVQNKKMELNTVISTITPLDDAAMVAARERQAQLAKPPGSLGRLEELSIQLAGITGLVHNKIEKKHLLVFAADNGVVEEGVSSAPQSVTLMQTINLTRAKTGASTLCKHFGCGITVCDVGVNADIPEPKVLNRKIAYGTHNIVKGPAMSRKQAVKAIMTGIELAKETDADVIGIGEMGIGNTTTSSAVLSVLLDADVDAVTGRGAVSRMRVS